MSLVEIVDAVALEGDEAAEGLHPLICDNDGVNSCHPYLIVKNYLFVVSLIFI